MRAYGSAQAIAGTGHIPLPTEPRATSADLTDRLEQARQRRAIRITWPEPTPEAPVVQEPAQRAPRPPKPRRKTTAKASRPRKPRAPRVHELAGDFVDLYRQGYTVPHIATVTGAAVVTVRRWLRRSGIQMRDDRAGNSGGRNRRTWTAAELATAAELYATGATIADVARALNTGQRQARDALTAAGVSIRPAAHEAGRVMPP